MSLVRIFCLIFTEVLATRKNLVQLKIVDVAHVVAPNRKMCEICRAGACRSPQSTEINFIYEISNNTRLSGACTTFKT